MGKTVPCVLWKHKTMRTLEELLKENALADPDDLDALLELAEITGRMICDERYTELERLLAYTVNGGRYEAFSWVMAALQEEFDKKNGCRLKDFTCFIGRSIADYDTFIRCLQVYPDAIDDRVEMMTDHNGEVESFFNILTYRTAYRNAFLVTEENFDTKDNDFIRYKLRFTSDP